MLVVKFVDWMDEGEKGVDGGSLEGSRSLKYASKLKCVWEFMTEHKWLHLLNKWVSKGQF